MSRMEVMSHSAEHLQPPFATWPGEDRLVSFRETAGEESRDDPTGTPVIITSTHQCNNSALGTGRSDDLVAMEEDERGQEGKNRRAI